MIAHYLVLVIGTIESIFLWIGCLLARWMITHASLANDMLILYRASKAEPNNNDKHESRTLKSIRTLAEVLSMWLIIRFGYHFSTYFLVQKTIGFVAAIFYLFNLLKPGKKDSYTFNTICKTSEKKSLQESYTCQQSFNGI